MVSAFKIQIIEPPSFCISIAFNKCLSPLLKGGFITIKSYSLKVWKVKKSSWTTRYPCPLNTFCKSVSFSIQSISKFLLYRYPLAFTFPYSIRNCTISPFPADGSRTVWISFHSIPAKISFRSVWGVG